ncbi:MAG: exopolysaccharide biosynthesis protein [Candidatus Cloacimonetes bacterium]|nr:exopolysaccharide biosynthesis protein [Candidatus Cloacimonadota bacterium]MCF7814504.1 exopolysaccharide biosynthesis protein [Candidatus Cloacimonadota bacterium]MCF7869061.1 exopolysaccharide biosynthesis protein [Candidatus Cloacimonadota bacterium]MCF7884456.1 exopolysaccharide biosynthesis protein [Candidatus Cloacimonadota bacterium]
MIDIHTHILHSIDDGSQDIETSITHLKLMQEYGVKAVFVTPHFMLQYYDFDQQLVLDKIAELQKAAEKENINIKIIPGREIYLDSSLFEKLKSGKMNMGNSNYILVETNMTNFPADLNQHLYDLVRSGLKPIMAHPERYTNIINDPDSAEDLLHKNVLLQINAGSLIGIYGKNVQKAAWFLVDNGLAHFVASDNHCKELDYTLPAAVEMLKQKIDEHTAELLTEINPRKIIDNEPITYFYLEKVVTKKKGFFSKLFS